MDNTSKEYIDFRERDYLFYGKHAKMVKDLVHSFDGGEKKLFQYNKDVYIIAPLVGFLYKRKAKSTSKKGEGTETPVTINATQMLGMKEDILFAYRLIILSDNRNEPDFLRRQDKAFREYFSEKSKDDEMLFNEYVLGGVEILHEKIIGDLKEESYVENLYDFLHDFELEFPLKENWSDEKVLELAK